VQLLSDNPTAEDRLGFGATADVLFEAIDTARERPLTIGVFGGWGSGKTSLMRMVQQRLTDAGGKTVWFNAWKYDGKEVIWNALIQTIFLTMRRELEKTDSRTELRDRVVRAARELAKYAAKVGTRLVPGGIVKEEDVDQLWEALSSGADDPLFEFVNRFEATFDALVAEYVGEQAYLTVFIDDLDRCLPENAIEVMEALKLYLDQAQCVFVVGVEPGVIEEAIRRRYGDNPTLSATQYLEKIIQIPFVLPRIRADMVLALTGLFADQVVPGVDDQAVRREMVALVRHGMSRNPRRVKRFANSFMIASRIAEGVSSESQLVLAKVLVLQMSFPLFYRELVRDPGLIEKVSTADKSVWEREEIGHLYEDLLLRGFLEHSRRIPSGSGQVRRWIRLAQEDSEVDDLDSADAPAHGGG
jgi:predicted KAP-like P-loop ATPase